MNRLLSVLFWSVVAAAFIGPGTVTTAAAAGAAHGTALLWALGFSTLACLVLQEAAARLSILSGRDLAAALRHGAEALSGDDAPGADELRAGQPRAGELLRVGLVLGAVVLGCAAYEAGNLLGVAQGAALLLPFPGAWVALAAAGGAAVLLWFGTPRGVANLLAGLVALMGVAFLVTAVGLGPELGAVAAGLLVPRVPEGAGLLVLGLVGTTVVPYNLFLGSGLAVGSGGSAELGRTRFGLTVAVVLGGLISMAVLVVGSAVVGEFGFGTLAATLVQRLGPWAKTLLGLGLAAAGLSSAITAPWAAALVTRGLFARPPALVSAENDGEVSVESSAQDDPRWGPRSWRWRATWGGVLAFGVVVLLVEVDAVPAIILAQALNGVLLPVAAVYLLLAVNDRRLMGAGGLNGPVANLLAAVVTAVTVVLGVSGVLRAGARAAGLPAPGEGLLLGVAAVITVLVAVPVARAVVRRRRGRGRVRPRRG